MRNAVVLLRRRLQIVRDTLFENLLTEGSDNIVQEDGDFLLLE